MEVCFAQVASGTKNEANFVSNDNMYKRLSFHALKVVIVSVLPSAHCFGALVAIMDVVLFVIIICYNCFNSSSALLFVVPPPRKLFCLLFTFSVSENVYPSTVVRHVYIFLIVGFLRWL